MITSQMLRQLMEAGPDPMLIDYHGEPIEVEGLPHDAVVPALLVRKVTEAVKQVEEDMVVHYLNRDALWAVEGFLLDHNVVSSLPDRVDSASSLVQAVTDAGFEWYTVLI